MVKAGDTLQSLAAALRSDTGFWYVLAETSGVLAAPSPARTATQAARWARSSSEMVSWALRVMA
jgi:hypothetical protein